MSSKFRFSLNRETGSLTEENTKSYFSRLGWGVFTLGIASTAASAVLSAAVALYFPPSVLENSVALTLLQHIITLIAIYCVALPLFCKVIAPLPTIKPIKSRMSVGSFVGGACVALLLMMIGSYISSFVLTLIQLSLKTTTQNPIEEAISPDNPWIVLITTVFMVVLFPILEELLFRKILCGKLLALGEGYAIFISAAIFGLIHGNFYQFAYAFLLGALFALIYVKTGKLIYSTLYHIMINFFGAVLTPWLMTKIDLEVLYKILEANPAELTADMYNSIATTFLYLLLYDAITMIPAIAGIILLIRTKKSNRIRLETGIITPPKKGRLANIFCTVGVAAAITYFAFTFVLSLLP